MRTLLCSLFSLVLVVSVTMITAIDSLADPGENNGNHYGQINNGNNGNHFGQIKNGNSQSVPIPATLILFAGGFAGLIAWQGLSRRKLPQGKPSSEN